MNKTIKALISLGLSDKEAQVYIALYKLGKGTSYQIAKESGLKRPTVYVLMEELRKKGLALIVPHEKNQVFIAKNPREFIYEYQIEQNRNIQDILSSLPTLTRQNTNTEILSLKGVGTLAHGLLYGLHKCKEKQIYAFYAPVPKKAKVNPAYLDHKKEIHRLGFKLKCIIPTDSDDRLFRDGDKEFGFDVKKIDQKLFSPNVSIEVCDYIVKYIFHAKREVVIMEDRDLAEFYKQVFMMVWGSNTEK